MPRAGVGEGYMPRSVAASLFLSLLSLAACRSGLTAPTDAGTNYTGRWTGTTSQGASIVFTVSSDQIVTAIAVGHDFNGCRGTETFSGLSLIISRPGFSVTRMPTLSGASTSSNPAFGFGSGSPESPTFTQITGMFLSTTTATGTVTFLSFPGCGNGVALWNASR